MVFRVCLLFWVMSLVGCHDHVTECLDWDGPVFQTDNLPPAFLNQEYAAEIQVQIENEPQDDLFFYHFDYDVSDLPFGLSYRHWDHSRVLKIEGTPTESGIFTLDVEVRVSGYVDLCFHSNRARYTLIVNEL